MDLIDGAAAECYVTSKELRYRRCGGYEVTVRHARAASGHNRPLVPLSGHGNGGLKKPPPP
jgi:hypothetical protein